MMKRKLSFIVLLIPLVIIGCVARKELTKTEKLKTEADHISIPPKADRVTPEQGEKCPLFNTKNINDGSEVALSDFIGGKIIIINFWDPRSVSALREVRFLESLYKKYQQDLKIIGIESSGCCIEEIKDTLAKWKQIGTNVSYTILPDEDLKITKCYQVNAIPWTFIIDLNGVIRYNKRGFEEADEKTIISILKGLLKTGIKTAKKEEKIKTTNDDDKTFNKYRAFADFYFHKEDYNQAIKYYRKALDFDPADVSIYYCLIDIYLLQKKYDQALLEWTKLIKIDPYNEKAKFYIDKIGEGVYKR